MSEKIGPNANPVTWSDTRLDDVRELRRAVTEKLEEDAFDADVMPMMGEFLTRLDDLVGEEDAEFAPPPFSGEPPTPREALAALHEAISAVEALIDARPEEAPRLGSMLDVLRHYTKMKDEVIHRVDGGRQA
jgi:hypothetical protein